MIQFMVGFWCGFAAGSLVLCLLYKNKKKETGFGTAAERKEDKLLCEKEGNSSGFRILLVDDSKLSRTVIKGFLENKSVEIVEAENGTEGLKLVKKFTFDLIFLDQHMPGLDGDETLQVLRQGGYVGKDVPVVALSSTMRGENEKSFLERGYIECLGKPIQKNRLEEIVSQVMESGKRTRIPEGFSYEKGLENFDGNVEIYKETLVLFAELWEERKEQLHRFLEEENMAEYAILIHAIKGDARTLGAEVLGEAAYEQEMKAKAGDTEAIRNSFERIRTMGDETAEYFVKSFSGQAGGTQNGEEANFSN